jgi:hypothetical protein
VSVNSPNDPGLHICLPITTTRTRNRAQGPTNFDPTFNAPQPCKDKYGCANKDVKHREYVRIPSRWSDEELQDM